MLSAEHSATSSCGAAVNARAKGMYPGPAVVLDAQETTRQSRGGAAARAHSVTGRRLLGSIPGAIDTDRGDACSLAQLPNGTDGGRASVSRRGRGCNHSIARRRRKRTAGIGSSGASEEAPVDKGRLKCTVLLEMYFFGVNHTRA